MHQWSRRKMLSLCTAAIVVAFGFGLTPASLHAATVDVKFMNFNIRVDVNEADAQNEWPNRRDRVVTTIRNYSPDVLGINEDKENQGNYLKGELTSYNFYGSNGAAGGDNGEFVGIMYKKNKYEQVRAGRFWLSLTPDTPGSMGWDAANPRMCRWIELRDKANPSLTFVVMNTHWDHVGDAARRNSGRLIREKIAELAPGLPVVVMGDFNADQGSDAYDIMRGIGDFADDDTVRTLADTYRTLHPGDSGTVGTAHGFDGTAGDGRIDWILNDNRWDTIEAGIDRTFFNIAGSTKKYYPSDHFPINAKLRIEVPAIPEPAGASLLGATASLALLKRARRRH